MLQQVRAQREISQWQGRVDLARAAAAVGEPSWPARSFPPSFLPLSTKRSDPRLRSVRRGWGGEE